MKHRVGFIGFGGTMETALLMKLLIEVDRAS